MGLLLKKKKMVLEMVVVVVEFMRFGPDRQGGNGSRKSIHF